MTRSIATSTCSKDSHLSSTEANNTPVNLCDCWVLAVDGLAGFTAILAGCRKSPWQELRLEQTTQWGKTPRSNHPHTMRLSETVVVLSAAATRLSPSADNNAWCWDNRKCQLIVAQKQQTQTVSNQQTNAMIFKRDRGFMTFTVFYRKERKQHETGLKRGRVEHKQKRMPTFLDF